MTSHQHQAPDSPPVPARPRGAAPAAGRRRAARATTAGCVLAATVVLGAIGGAPRGALAQTVPDRPARGPLVHYADPGLGPLVRYADPGGRYQFTYPAAWTPSHPRGVDVEVAAPDGNAALWAVTGPAPASATAIDVRGALERWGTQLGQPVGAVRYGRYTAWNGVTILWGATAVRRARGTLGLAMVAGTAYGGYTVTLYGAIGDTHAASWPQDGRHLGGIMGSLVINGGPAQGPARPPSTGVAATCGALKKQMTNFSQLAGLYHGMGDSEYMDDQLALADYYYQKANWYNRVVQADYQQAGRLHCFG